MFLTPLFTFAENAWMNADVVVIITSAISVAGIIGIATMHNLFTKKNHFDVAGKVTF